MFDFYPSARVWHGSLRLFISAGHERWHPLCDGRRATLPLPCTTRVSALVDPLTYALFKIAFVGATPVVTYRQSAIINRRATATMPTRRRRGV